MDSEKADARTGLVNGNDAEGKTKKHTMNEKKWVVVTTYCGVYEIQTIEASLADETTRITSPMTWEEAVAAVKEYEQE